MTTYIKQSDVEVDTNVYVSHQVKYSTINSQKKIEEFRKMCKAAKRTLIPKINAKVKKKLPIRFVLRHIKANGVAGRCLGNKKYICIEIDFGINGNLKRMAKTMAHELVHAEQYMTGRLEWNMSKACWMWEKKKCLNMGSTHNSYMNQPWEKEAYERQDQGASELIGFYNDKWL